MADARALLKAKRLERGAGPKPKLAVRAATRDDEHLVVRKGKRKLEATTTAATTMADVPKALSPSPAVSVSVVDDDAVMMDAPNDKRRRIEESEEHSASSPAAGSGFPADFFSDPSRSVPILADDDDDDNEDVKDDSHRTSSHQNAPAQSQPSALSSSISTQPNPTLSSIDDEFAAFERAIQAAAVKQPKRDTQVDAFAKATIAAEPELVTYDTSSGFPPSIGGNGGVGEESRSGEMNNAEPEVDESEIDQRMRKQEEERELIMDRLLDEERAQEDADAKVNALKARLEAIKLKRAAKKNGAGQ